MAPAAQDKQRDQKNQPEAADKLRPQALVPVSALAEAIGAYPPGSRMQQVTATITARPVGRATLGEVADVRPDALSDHALIIDFGRLRSPSSLIAPPGQQILKVFRWLGDRFDEDELVTLAGQADREEVFSELRTERVRVEAKHTVDVSVWCDEGRIVIEEAPADLVVTVGGAVAWSQSGPARLEQAPPEPEDEDEVRAPRLDEKQFAKMIGQYTFTISGRGRVLDVEGLLTALAQQGMPISSALRAELIALAGQMMSSGGLSTVELDEFAALMKKRLLAAGVRVVVAGPPQGPGPRRFFTLDLDLTQAMQTALDTGREPIVALAASAPHRLQLAVEARFLPVHPVAFPAGALGFEALTEGRQTVVLPAPSGPAAGVELTIAGGDPERRALPAEGPAATARPGGGAAISARLDALHALVARLPQLDLDRLGSLVALRVPLTIDAGGAELVATMREDATNAPGPVVAKALIQPVPAEAGEAWVELALAKPLAVTQGQGLWLELAASRGTAWWDLAADAAASGVATLRRGLPGGPFVPFAGNIGLGGTPVKSGRLHLIGTSLVAGGVPALTLLMGDGPSGSPGRGSVTLAAAFAAPLNVGPNGLSVPLRIAAPGRYTITAARLIAPETTTRTTSTAP